MIRSGILGIALSCAILQGCAPATGPVGLPARPGVYPHAEGGPSGRRATLVPSRREPGWRPSAEAAGTLQVNAPIGAVLAALPAIGSPVPLRSSSWPRPVQLSHVGDASFAATGEWVRMAGLGSELRCQGRAAGERARIVAEVTDAGGHLLVEATYEWSGAMECEVSASGTERLERAAMDVYLWVRGLAREGTAVPAAS